MPHAPSLIESISVLLRSDYPPDQYLYVIEQQLDGHSNRMFPDIQVLHHDGDNGNRCVCAVEIGYTRPEKLAFYRQIGIPDVRWYAKNGSHVHDQWDIKLHRNIDVAPDYINFCVIEATPDELNWTAICDECYYELMSEDGAVDGETEEWATCVEQYTVITNMIRIAVFAHCGQCGTHLVNDVDHFLDFHDMDADVLMRTVDRAERRGYCQRFKSLAEAAQPLGEVAYDALYKL